MQIFMKKLKERRYRKMVDLYVKLIKAGKKTLDDVPENLREAVRKALEE